METKTHWERVYGTKRPTEVSWYQARPETSLRLIRETGAAPGDPLIDVGGGASTLVDELLAAGYRSITVLDVSATALSVARERLGGRAADVTWLEADITNVALPRAAFRVWHDRAVFHFLTLPEDRSRYVDAVREAVRPAGHVIVATFALEGPPRCSGLDCVRYSAASLHDEFGPGFDLVASTEEAHHTPNGADQRFVYCLLKRV